MIGWLLDTNVISSMIAPNGAPSVKKWASSVDESRLYISVLTLAKYAKGIENLKIDDPNRSKYIASQYALQKRFQGRILSVLDNTIMQWGVISGRIKRETGHSPPVIDTLLAASAINANLYLVTRNTRDVKLSGAVIFDPWNDNSNDFKITI